MTGIVLFLVFFVVLITTGWLWLSSKKKHIEKAKEEDRRKREERLAELPSIPLSEREDDAIYQWSTFHGDRLVARVVGAEVDRENRRVHFVELTHSDLLLLPDVCEFRKYQLEVDTVGDAMKVDKNDPEKGRILRQVTARITGYVEQ